MKKLILLSAITVSLFACSKDNKKDETLSGKVYNTSFTAKGGKTVVSDKKIDLNITNVAAACDSDLTKYEYAISTTVDKKVGKYEANVAFSAPKKSPFNVTKSTVEVLSINDKNIKVYIKSKSGKEHSIEGSYTLPICK